jgi:hypothetical protein
MMPLIVVIDSEEPRAGEMAGAFVGLDCRVVQVWAGQRRLHFSPDEALPKECTIRLWHLRDLHEQCRGMQSRLTVYYGGNGGRDKDRPEDGGEIIWRPVADETGVLTRSEAVALLAFAQEGGSRPAFLCPPSSFEIVGALAMLCQGYLAVCAAHDLCKDSDHATQALKSMGWSAECTSLLSEPSKLSAVKSPSWWLAAFDFRVGVGGDDPQWQMFVDGLHREWGTADGLRAVRTLSSKMVLEEGLSVDDVARAYSAIAERLRANSGGQR